ncbi:hypothetical protein F2Q68_00034248 [Brassica cretica]|uniref:Uncharacterized protein n=1 Tax=Brassica cretica TaxID=69181 RepID=A0A8S9HBJ3_BRACR|nr:hypothetical protein F2Q68_00034248 [Brassica cretica]
MLVSHLYYFEKVGCDNFGIRAVFSPGSDPRMMPHKRRVVRTQTVRDAREARDEPVQPAVPPPASPPID